MCSYISGIFLSLSFFLLERHIINTNFFLASARKGFCVALMENVTLSCNIAVAFYEGDKKCKCICTYKTSEFYLTFSNFEF